MNFWLVLIPLGIVLVALTQLFTEEYMQKVGVAFGIAMMIIGFILGYYHTQLEATQKK